MKKFFTNIPLQKEGQLCRCHYQAQGSSHLAMEEKTSFPIIPAINGYASPDEEFRVIAVVQDNPDAKRNYGLLQEELRELCLRRGFSYPKNGVEAVNGPDDQKVTSNVATFQSLLDYTDDEDELFACVSFGTKPMSMALLTAMRYAYRLKRNTTVSCVVYGEVDRRNSKDPEQWICRIYDETALVQLDEITRVLANRGVRDPQAVIEKMLKG